VTDPQRYFAQSLIDPALTRDIARLRAELGPIGLNLPESATEGHPVEAPHFGVTIWGHGENISIEHAERMRVEQAYWDRLRVSTLVLHDVDGRWVVVAHEPVSIADQDPDLWGDQA
jgi:hypothetical protein